MKRILLIARREWLEQIRQPTMLTVICLLFCLVGGIVMFLLWALEEIMLDPESMEMMATLLPDLGTTDLVPFLQAAAKSAVLAYDFLVFTQFLGITAVLSGHAVLHDRQCGTFTFLLLSPIRRSELLAGKVLGAMGPSLGMYFIVCGGYAVMISSFGVVEEMAPFLFPAPAWLVAFCLGGPLWAAFISACCVVVSTLVRDVRTAQQVVWFGVFFATFIGGFLLSYVLDAGVAVQLGVAGLGLAGTATAIAVGTQVISRDLSR